MDTLHSIEYFSWCAFNEIRIKNTEIILERLRKDFPINGMSKD